MSCIFCSRRTYTFLFSNNIKRRVHFINILSYNAHSLTLLLADLVWIRMARRMVFFIFFTSRIFIFYRFETNKYTRLCNRESNGLLCIYSFCLFVFFFWTSTILLFVGQPLVEKVLLNFAYFYSVEKVSVKSRSVN